MDLEFWAKEAVKAAPVIFAAGVFVIGTAIWWLRGHITSEQIKGRDARIEALKETLNMMGERLKLAHESTESAELENQKLQQELNQVKRYSAVVAFSKLEEHSLSAAFYSANLTKLLTRAIAATGPAGPEQRPPHDWIRQERPQTPIKLRA